MSDVQALKQQLEEWWQRDSFIAHPMEPLMRVIAPHAALFATTAGDQVGGLTLMFDETNVELVRTPVDLCAHPQPRMTHHPLPSHRIHENQWT